MYVCCEIIGRIHEGVTRSVVKEYNQGGHNCAQYACHVTRPEINFLHRQCRDVLQTDEIIPAKTTVSPGCDPRRRPQKKIRFFNRNVTIHPTIPCCVIKLYQAYQASYLSTQARKVCLPTYD